MAVIYLRHPSHGTKVACSEMESKYDQSHGWEIYDPAYDAIDEIQTEHRNALAGGTIIEVRKQWQEKFGREPHHRKSIETLKSELEQK